MSNKSLGNRPKGSRPVWGAWIEIAKSTESSSNDLSRAPYGARGLKLVCGVVLLSGPGSRPVWGAWIEITELSANTWPTFVAPRMGRVD